MSYREYFDKKPTLGQSNNALVILFAINSFFFIIIRFLKLVYDLDYGSAAYSIFEKKIVYWFTISVPLDALLTKPFSLLLYMFSHYSIVGFISNMLWLWAFGYVLQDLVGNKKLIPIYLYGGFIAGLVFTLTANFLPFIYQNINTNYLLEGSSAAIMAVAIATTTLSPRYKIYQHIGNGFQLWILTLIYLAVDVAYIISNNWAVGFAHIAAAAVGYFYIKQLQKGNDWGSWIFTVANKINNLFNPEQKHKNKSSKENHFYKNSVPAYTKHENVNEQKLNEILDKISSKGFSSLTSVEKDFLDRASKEE